MIWFRFDEIILAAVKKAAGEYHEGSSQVRHNHSHNIHNCSEEEFSVFPCHREASGGEQLSQIIQVVSGIDRV